MFDLRPAFHVVGILLSVSLVAPPSSWGAERTQPNSDASAADSISSIDQQLATARLELAKVELERALDTNKRSPVYPGAAIELLRRNVEVAQAHREALMQPGARSLHSAHLRELESSLAIANLKWKAAVQLRERMPSAIDASEVEAARLRAEVARLALARARDPAHVATPIDHMQWQLEQLRQEMLELTLRVEELSYEFH